MMTDLKLKCQLCKRWAVMKLVGLWPRCKRHETTRIGCKHVHEKRAYKRNHRGQSMPRAIEYDSDYVGAGHKDIDKSGGALGRMKPGNEAVYVCELCPEVGSLTLTELQAHYKQVHNRD